MTNDILYIYIYIYIYSHNCKYIIRDKCATPYRETHPYLYNRENGVCVQLGRVRAVLDLRDELANPYDGGMHVTDVLRSLEGVLSGDVTPPLVTISNVVSIPYYTILYYTILYYTILYYTILYYTIPYYTILYYTILYYTILYYTILYYTILYYTILYYTILYYTICL